MYRKNLKIFLLSLIIHLGLLTLRLRSEGVKIHNNDSSVGLEKALPYLLDININQVQNDESVLSYVDDYQHILIPADVLKKHGLKVDMSLIKNDYISLHEIDWIQSKIDLNQQKLWLTIPVDKFSENIINGNQDISKTVLDTDDPGFYINYDISTQSIQGKHLQGLSGLGEFVHFNSYGFGSISGLAYKNRYQQKFTRLDTTWSYDQPENQITWRFGDSVTRSDDWGGSARFGGIQWATNYTFQPNFITFPTPSIKGASSVPSNLDIFVNDALQLSKKVDRGSFGINDLPVVNGQGNVTLVTKDILGRRQEVVIPYYVNQDLLKVGLQDYSFELGSIRHHYGIKSNHYGQGVMSGTYRRGLTDQWTLGGHSEMTAKIQNIGLTNQYLLAYCGILTNSLAVSRHSIHRGILFSQGFTRQTKTISFGTKIQITKGFFSEIGLYRTQYAPQLTLQNFASYSLKDYGSIGVSYTETRNRRISNLKLMTLNYQKTVAKNFNLNLFASHNFKRQDKQIGLSLIYIINDRSSAIATTQYQPKNSSKSLAYQENKVMESNISYRLLASQGAYQHYETEIDLDQVMADYKLRASRVQNASNVELNARGALIYFGNKAFLSKYIYNSFGMVHVPNLSNISIYESNRFVGKTNADGYLLLPNLRSYEDNNVKIESKDLPLDAIFKKDEASLKPARRSGAIARFDVNILKMITIHVVDEKNNDLIPGTLINDKAKAKKYVVGLEGEVYVEVPSDQEEIQLEAAHPHSCIFKVSASKLNKSSQKINTYQCKNISNL